MIVFTESEPAPEPRLIDAFERLHRLRISAEFRDFLLTTNGGIPSLCGLVMTDNDGRARSTLLRRFLAITDSPYRDLRRAYRSTAGKSMPPELCPIAYDAGDSYLCIHVGSDGRNGGVYFWDRAFQPHARYNWSNIYAVADSLTGLFDQLST